MGSEWIGPSQGQLDPVKEIQAEQLACDNGFSTREQATVRLNGGSFEANAEQLATENEMLKGGQSQPNDDDDLNKLVAELLPRIINSLRKEEGKV